MKLILIVFILITFFSNKVFAQEYVFPYPGLMPGHPLYNLSEFADRIQELWSFGSLSSFKYNLWLADKKLVQAKTLFEYKQYSLAMKALSSYKERYSRASLFLLRAQEEGKDVNKQRVVFTNAKKKHISVLEKLKTELPEEFTWIPEKGAPETLKIRKLIDDASSN